MNACYCLPITPLQFASLQEQMEQMEDGIVRVIECPKVWNAGRTIFRTEWGIFGCLPLLRREILQSEGSAPTATYWLLNYPGKQ